jgi:hypothetical protein
MSSSFRGALLREPGIHNPRVGVQLEHYYRGYGFRAYAKWRIPE